MNENDSSKIIAKVTIADDTYIYLNKLNPKAVNTVTSFSISDPSFSVIIEKAPKGTVTKDKDYLSLEKSGNFELTIFDSGLKRKDKTGKFELRMLTQACTKAGVCYKSATLSKEIKFEISGARKVFSSNTRNLSTKEVNWLTKYNEAKEKAKKTGQNLYVIVSAPEWCGPCRYMDQNTFKAKTVFELLNNSFIPLYIHADTNPDVGNFPVRGIPAHLIQDSTGKTVYQTAGAMDENRFVSVMSPYAKKSTETTNTTNNTDTTNTTNNTNITPPELPDNIPLPDLPDTKPTVNTVLVQPKPDFSTS
jgi:thioredoxin-related protein